MKIIQIIESELNEVINTHKELHPNVKNNDLIPIFMTWDEYYNKINPDDIYHDIGAYEYKYDPKAIFKCPSGSSCKIIKRSKINKIELEYIIVTRKREFAKFDGDKYIGIYSDEELKKLGKEIYAYDIYATHNNVVVGGAQDEWGATLIYVVDQYKGLGIGEQLVKMYRKIYPNKSSGGFTSGGYKQIKKYYNWMIKQALANGVYSDLIRKGEISKEKVNAIIGSIDNQYQFSKEKKNKLKDIYGGNKEPIYIIQDNIVVIFDSALKDINEDSLSELDDSFIKDMIYTYVYVTHFNDFPQVLDCYGDEKYIKEAIEILATKNKQEGGLGDYYFRKFDPNIKKILSDIWDDSNKYNKKTIKDGGYIKGVDLNIITPKRDVSSKINLLNRIKKYWFKGFDKYGEIEDRIQEIAYGFIKD